MIPSTEIEPGFAFFYLTRWRAAFVSVSTDGFRGPGPNLTSEFEIQVLSWNPPIVECIHNCIHARRNRHAA